MCYLGSDAVFNLKSNSSGVNVHHHQNVAEIGNTQLEFLHICCFVHFGDKYCTFVQHCIYLITVVTGYFTDYMLHQSVRFTILHGFELS